MLFRSIKISIPYQGSTAVLLGDTSDLPVGFVLHLCLIFEEVPSVSANPPLPVVQPLLSEFVHLFETSYQSFA